MIRVRKGAKRDLPLCAPQNFFRCYKQWTTVSIIGNQEKRAVEFTHQIVKKKLPTQVATRLSIRDFLKY